MHSSVISSLEDEVPASLGTARVADAAPAGDFGCLVGFLACHLRRHSNNTSGISSMNRAQTTAIPTIAAAESFFDLLWAGFRDGLPDDGDGDGDPKNGLQAFRGPPQRSGFPENADSGNFDRLAGIEPLRLLLEMLKSFSPSESKLGSVPEKWLFSMNSPVKWVKLLMVKGIGPEKLFDETSRRVKRVSRVTLGGNLPEKALSWR